MYKMIDVKQGAEEWFKAKLGIPSASNFSKIITKSGKASTSVDDLVNRYVAEIIMEEPDDSFQSDSMLRGNELEEQALEFFNFTYGYNFKPCGFMQHEDGYGCSPDGVDLKIKMGLELKCPEAHTHLGYLSGGVLPAKYRQQVQGSLAVSGFKRWVFGSYHPSLPCFRIEVERDEKLISAMKPLLINTCIEVKKKHSMILELIGT